MAEPTITLAYSDLAEETGRYLGYGRTSGSWSTDQTDDVNLCVNSGYRQFLFPPPLPNEATTHTWSFLNPCANFSTTSGDVDYTLPDAFGGMVGDAMSFKTDTGYWTIPIIPEGKLREMLSAADTSGRPAYAAVRTAAFDADVGQRYEMLLYPEPDGIYAISYRYVALPAKLSSGDPYPLGGPIHSETLLAACLAQAERLLNDESGVQQATFMRLLATSIAHDRQMHAPGLIGYNGDMSDGGEPLTRGDLVYTVTYNGTSYP